MSQIDEIFAIAYGTDSKTLSLVIRELDRILREKAKEESHPRPKPKIYAEQSHAIESGRQ